MGLCFERMDGIFLRMGLCFEPVSLCFVNLFFYFCRECSGFKPGHHCDERREENANTNEKYPQ